MKCDYDQTRVASAVARAVGAFGRRVRSLRRDAATFYEDCVSLDIAGWNPTKHPGVLAGAHASALLRTSLTEPSPFLACRLGTLELAAMAACRHDLTAKNAVRMALGDPLVRDLGVQPHAARVLCRQAGFFPPRSDSIRRFAALMENTLPQIDVLGTWCKQEALFLDELCRARRVRFRDLEPYMHASPWTTALRGKRVLVVHPFARTIEYQYRTNRTRLFKNPDVLPDFELDTVTAVQSSADAKTPFADWFEALEYMKNEIDAKTFDIAILGCGAYGIPLASHVKSMGRKAVHLGGQTQLLFGIRGKRWETGHDLIKSFFNEHWVTPDSSERPAGYRLVEHGAYW